MLQLKEDDSVEFKWGKRRGVGGIKKDVQFFESFTYDNVEYTLYDSVYMYAEEEPEPYIGKIIKIWENANKTKKVKILWFFRPCEVKNFIGAHKILDNELFLASGEGLGLANVNPLEVIAGKCNVVCISKDSRNTQPSNEEIQMADFIFYRTFDVGRRLILDKIDDKIAGVDAKSLLNKVTQKSSIGPIPDSSKKELNGNAIATGAVVLYVDNTPGEQKTLKMDKNPTNASAKEKDNSKVLLIHQKSSLGQKPASSAGTELVEMVKVDHTQGGSSGDKITSAVNAESVRLSVRQKSSPVEKSPSNIGNQLGEVKLNGPHKDTARDKTNSRSSDKDIEKGKPSLVKQKSYLGDTNASNLGVELDEMAENIRQGRIPNDKITSTKTVNQNTTTSENKSKHKFVKNLHENDNISSKKPKLVKDEQVHEVIPKPKFDKSKWFKEHVVPWEERLQTAQAEGKLVLLQNLDISCTAVEVEDIVRRAFNQNCTAKIVQRTAFFSPFYGRALVIFKTREATETVLTKLDEGCLVLSNGRPLVGSIATLSFPGKPSTFFGHISIDKLRLFMPREMKEAVSTSHCSQPNTVEYDMAMDWCLLQERTDLEWKLLHKQQREECRELFLTLKSKVN